MALVGKSYTFGQTKKETRERAIPLSHHPRLESDERADAPEARASTDDSKTENDGIYCLQSIIKICNNYRRRTLIQYWQENNFRSLPTFIWDFIRSVQSFIPLEVSKLSFHSGCSGRSKGLKDHPRFKSSWEVTACPQGLQFLPECRMGCKLFH